MTYVPVDDLIAALGLTVALKLVENLGGRGIYTPGPAKLRSDHALVKAIGMEGARKFATEWRHMDVMLPRCEEELRRRRDSALRHDARTQSIGALAGKYDLTERHVYRILAASDEDEITHSAQAKLF